MPINLNNDLEKIEALTRDINKLTRFIHLLKTFETTKIKALYIVAGNDHDNTKQLEFKNVLDDDTSVAIFRALIDSREQMLNRLNISLQNRYKSLEAAPGNELEVINAGA